MLTLLSAAGFLFFLVRGANVARRSQLSNVAAKRRAINFFLAYTLVVSFAAGLAQRELWPFSRWELIAGIVPDAVGERFAHPRVVALDADGAEHEIDYRAWEPFSLDQ